MPMRRIAAVHAGLKLTADQESCGRRSRLLVKELAKLKIDRANARMNPPKDDSSQQKPDRSGVAAARPGREYGSHGDGHEEDRRRRRPALQDAR